MSINLFFILFSVFFVHCSATIPVGWHWYNNPAPFKNTKKEKKIIPGVTSHKSATEEVKTLQAMVLEARSKAILYPTEKNIANYIALQNFVVNQASTFSNQWKKTLLDHPALDYSVLHPTENNAQHIEYERIKQNEQRAIDDMAKNFGLFFFYRGKNALDKELAPSIQGFAKENHLALIPISVDGELLPGFTKNSRIDQGQARSLGIHYFPALMLINPKTKEVKALNYGFISQDELRQRFLDIATDFTRDS